MNVEFGHERAVLIEVINDSLESRRLIKSNNMKYEQFLEKTLKQSLKNTDVLDRANQRATHRAIPATESEIDQLFRQEFALTEHSVKDLLIAHMLTTALEKYEQQGASFLDPKAYDLLSDHNLKIIELWEQASVCPKCPNFERTLSTFPKRDSKCLNCKQDNLTVRIYVLNENYERHKKNNKDLPLYVCRLINSKRKGSAVISEPISKTKSNQGGDIDVWIKKTLTGIECKLRIPQARYLDEQLESYSKDIVNDFEKYIQFGAKHLVAVTSCNKDDASKLHKLLVKSLGGKCESLRVVHRSVSDLVKMASEELEKIRSL